MNHGRERLAACHLYNARERRVVRASSKELLVSGLRYVFPAKVGVVGNGMPTSISGSSALSSKLALGDDDHVEALRPSTTRRHSDAT